MKPTWIAAVLVGFVFLIEGAGALRAAQKDSSSGKQSAKEVAGRKLFIQRCSICHLPPLNEPQGRPFGPPLKNFANTPERETRAAEVIRKGTARMPGFQYGLKPEEIEEIVAYLKTMH